MRSYNFVVDVTPDFEDVQVRIRAMDFDQQSYSGRKNFYLPQFFRGERALAEFCTAAKSMFPRRANTRRRSRLSSTEGWSSPASDSVRFLDVMCVPPPPIRFRRMIRWRICAPLWPIIIRTRPLRSARNMGGDSPSLPYPFARKHAAPAGRVPRVGKAQCLRIRTNLDAIDWGRLRGLRDGFLDGSAGQADYWRSDADLTLLRPLPRGSGSGWKWDAVIAEMKLRAWAPPPRASGWGLGGGVWPPGVCHSADVGGLSGALRGRLSG